MDQACTALGSDDCMPGDVHNLLHNIDSEFFNITVSETMYFVTFKDKKIQN